MKLRATILRLFSSALLKLARVKPPLPANKPAAKLPTGKFTPNPPPFNQILFDARAILDDLTSEGYDTSMILLLLANMYGKTMVEANNLVILDENSMIIPMEKLELKFFELCVKERVVGTVMPVQDNVVNIFDKRKLN